MRTIVYVRICLTKRMTYVCVPLPTRQDVFADDSETHATVHAHFCADGIGSMSRSMSQRPTHPAYSAGRLFRVLLSHSARRAAMEAKNRRACMHACTNEGGTNEHPRMRQVSIPLNPPRGRCTSIPTQQAKELHALYRTP